MLKRRTNLGSEMGTRGTYEPVTALCAPLTVPVSDQMADGFSVKA